MLSFMVFVAGGRLLFDSSSLGQNHGWSLLGLLGEREAHPHPSPPRVSVPARKPVVQQKRAEHDAHRV